MKKISFTIVLLLLSAAGFAQIKFESGYIVRENGDKTNLLIKNVDWKNNPSEISIKTTPDSSPVVLGIDEVQEFGINNNVKYVKATVPVGTTGSSLQEPERTGDFNARDETVLLKVLIEGDANLYLLQKDSEKLYFMRANGGEIEPLIYKEFVPLKSVKIHENNHFRQQLLNNLKCENINARDVENLRYNKKDLRNIFEAYNKCKDKDFSTFDSNENKELFHLSIRPGVNFDQLSLETVSTHRKIEFDQQTSFRLGLEAEFVLPFLKNKWSILGETTYHYFKGDAEFPSGNENLEDGSVSVDYKAIALGIGVRHTFFLNSNSKFFLNAAVLADISLGGSNMDFDSVYDTYEDFEFNKFTEPSFSLGAGYGIKKWSFEGQVIFPRPLTPQELNSKFSGYSLVVGYQLF